MDDLENRVKVLALLIQDLRKSTFDYEMRLRSQMYILLGMVSAQLFLILPDAIEKICLILT